MRVCLFVKYTYQLVHEQSLRTDCNIKLIILQVVSSISSWFSASPTNISFFSLTLMYVVYVGVQYCMQCSSSMVYWTLSLLVSSALWCILYVGWSWKYEKSLQSKYVEQKVVDIPNAFTPFYPSPDSTPQLTDFFKQDKILCSGTEG